MKLPWTRSKMERQPPTLWVALFLALALQYSTRTPGHDRQTKTGDWYSRTVRTGVRKIPALPFVVVSYSITVCTSVHRQYFKIPRTIFYADVGCSYEFGETLFPEPCPGTVRSTKSHGIHITVTYCMVLDHRKIYWMVLTFFRWSYIWSFNPLFDP
jgi:hypothetical protein